MSKSGWANLPPASEKTKIDPKDREEVIHKIITGELFKFMKQVWDSIATIDGTAADFSLAMNLSEMMLPGAALRMLAKNSAIHSGMIESFEAVFKHLHEVVGADIKREFGGTIYDKHGIGHDAVSAAEALRAGMEAITDELNARRGVSA